MRPVLLGLAVSVGFLAAALVPHAAEARIKCDGRYQVTKHGLISTPYCEDNYLAAIAGYNARALRQNPHLKQQACYEVGHDPRVRDLCLGYIDRPGRRW